MDIEKEKFMAMFPTKRPFSKGAEPNYFRRIDKRQHEKRAVAFRISDATVGGSEFRKTKLEVMLGFVRCAWQDYQHDEQRFGQGHENTDDAKSRLNVLWEEQDTTRYFAASHYSVSQHISFQWQQHAVHDETSNRWSDTYGADIGCRFEPAPLKFLSRLRKKLKTVLDVTSPTIGNVICCLHLMNGIQVRYSPLMNSAEWIEDSFPAMSRVVSLRV